MWSVLKKLIDPASTSAAEPDPAASAHGEGVTYAPVANGLPDPGEVCWAWVPYEDDPSQGKDRPVLIVGTRVGTWLGLMLTSKDHDRSAVKELPNGVAVDHFGHRWLDIGSGPWDASGRPSEVRLDRVIPISHVRREGGAIDRALFDQVVALADL